MFPNYGKVFQKRELGWDVEGVLPKFLPLQYEVPALPEGLR